MKQERLKQQLIEKYLLGRLKGDNLDEFTFRLMRDKSLQQEVNAQRVLLKTLWKADATTVLSPSQTAESKKGTIIISLALALLSLVVLSFFFFLPTDAPQEAIPKPIDDTQGLIPIEKDTTQQPIELEVPKREEKTVPNSQQKTPKKEASSATKPTLIAANFEPNPALENYIGQLRGGSLLVNLPAPSATFELANEHFLFKLNGTFIPDKADFHEAISIHFFDNKKASYEQFTPLLTSPLELEQEESTYRFQWQERLAFPSALYYYQIEGEESGLLYVGKFEVK